MSVLLESIAQVFKTCCKVNFTDIEIEINYVRVLIMWLIINHSVIILLALLSNVTMLT